jgi:hypothetical protein
MTASSVFTQPRPEADTAKRHETADCANRRCTWTRDCSQTSGFGKGFGCRTLVHSNVAAFGYFPDAGGVYVVDGNLDLWQVGPPPVKIDGNVIDFQPLSPEQMLMRRADRTEGRGTRPVRLGGSTAPGGSPSAPEINPAHCGGSSDLALCRSCNVGLLVKLAILHDGEQLVRILQDLHVGQRISVHQ